MQNRTNIAMHQAVRVSTPTTALNFGSYPSLSQSNRTTTNNYIETRGDQDLLKITTLKKIFRFFREPEDFRMHEAIPAYLFDSKNGPRT